MRLHRLIRNRAIGITRRLLGPVRAWRRARAPVVVSAEEMSRRLELLLAAMYGRRFSVGAGASRAGGGGETQRQNDIVLPSKIVAHRGVEQARTQYRLLAIEQTARLVRGGADIELPADPLERDLYMIIEGASIDRAIVRQAPGLAAPLAELGRATLAGRPPLERLDGPEREVEALFREILSANPGAASGNVPETMTADESRRWAHERAARIRDVAATRPYRGIRAMGRWRISVPDSADRLAPFAAPSMFDNRPPVEDDAGEESDQAENDAHDGERGKRPDVHATVERDATAPVDGSAITDDMGRATEDAHSAAPGGVRYHEWDEYAGRYRPAEVTVHDTVAAETDDGWAVATLREHAPLVRQIRARFEPLRAQRTRLRAQRAGDELDLDACVAALVEMRRGRIPGDRLYQLTRPARRTLAILILVDVSGSTDSPVSPGRTVLDVERMTLLLASEALDALGDPYAVLAFSGSGRHDVQVDTVKSFAEHDPVRVRRRVSALVSARNTRLGAALRHATTLLSAQHAERRLLLLLSDGQPNDIGGYQGSYAAGDSRRAVLEARAAGVHPFCLTVDREEHEYLPHLFGANGYRILRSPSQLPAALLQVVTRMLPQ